MEPMTSTVYLMTACFIPKIQNCAFSVFIIQSPHISNYFTFHYAE